MVERDLCNRVQFMDIETIKAEVEEWVVNPGTTIGCLSSYERMITTHWVTKELVSHVLVIKENKALGDEEPIKAWKDNYHENWVMHKNIDRFVEKMGILSETMDVGERSFGARSRGPCPIHGLKIHTVDADDSRLGCPCPGGPVP